MLMDDKKRQEEIKKFYDEGDYFANINKYQSYSDLLKTKFQKYRIKKLLKIYTPSKYEKVLDLGCALGTMSFALAPYCNEIVGLDYSKKAISTANRLLQTSPYNNIKFIVASADNTNLPSNSFDVIISADLFEHLYPDVYKKTLDECRRVLKKGGKLVIWTPHSGHIIEILKNKNILLKKDISHVDYKKMKTLIKDLKERNFIIKKAFYAESHNPLFNILEKILLPILPIMRRRIAILAEKQ